MPWAQTTLNIVYKVIQLHRVSQRKIPDLIHLAQPVYLRTVTNLGNDSVLAILDEQNLTFLPSAPPE